MFESIYTLMKQVSQQMQQLVLVKAAQAAFFPFFFKG